MAALQPFHIQIRHSIDIDTAHPSPLPLHPIDIYAAPRTLKLPHIHSAPHIIQPQWVVTQLLNGLLHGLRSLHTPYVTLCVTWLHNMGVTIIVTWLHTPHVRFRLFCRLKLMALLH